MGHEPNGLNDRNALSDSSGSQKFKSRCAQGHAPSEIGKRIHPCLFPISGFCQQALVFLSLEMRNLISCLCTDSPLPAVSFCALLIRKAFVG